MEEAVDNIKRMEGPLPTEFYAVYDGHSGTQAVEFVKVRLPQALQQSSRFGDTDFVSEVLQEAFMLTEEELLRHLQQHCTPTQQQHRPAGAYVLSAGCVGCVALIRGDSLHIANLGDCRAVLCRQGEMTALTVDHRPQDNDGERERLEGLGVEVSSDGYVHGRIGVSRAFGDWAWDDGEKCKGLLCRPDVVTTEITSDTEFLLLACDGVFEKMTNREAGQIVRRRLRSAGDARGAAEAVVKHAVKRNGSDNVSAVVVLFKRPDPPPERLGPPQGLFGAKLSEAEPVSTAVEPGPTSET